MIINIFNVSNYEVWFIRWYITKSIVVIIHFMYELLCENHTILKLRYDTGQVLRNCISASIAKLHLEYIESTLQTYPKNSFSSVLITLIYKCKYNVGDHNFDLFHCRPAIGFSN